jgi:hypothetical protein
MIPINTRNKGFGEHTNFALNLMKKIIDLLNENNKNNCDIFIKLLDILNEKFKDVIPIKERHILYNKFMNNMRINNKYELNVF